MSLDKFLRYEILPFGWGEAMGPRPPLDPRLIESCLVLHGLRIIQANLIAMHGSGFQIFDRSL